MMGWRLAQLMFRPPHSKDPLGVAAAAGGKLNVVLFPWLAFGHMIPFTELAKRLAARGHAVTFLSTPRNVARLPPVPADLSPRVRLVALPAPVVEGLPEGAGRRAAGEAGAAQDGARRPRRPVRGVSR
jgi:hypothetical protein